MLSLSRKSMVLLFALLFAIAVVLPVNSARAQGGYFDEVTITVTCNSITASGPGDPDFPDDVFPISDLTTLKIVGWISFSYNPDTDIWSGSGTFSANPGDILTVFILPLWTVTECNGDGTSFNPGDGRVEPAPGDRIAVYCNFSKDGSFVLYGTDQKGKGVLLGIVTLDEVNKAGEGGLVKDTGKYGTMYIGAGGDGSTFWAAWSGAFGANASGPFAKVFTCAFNK